MKTIRPCYRHARNLSVRSAFAAFCISLFAATVPFASAETDPREQIALNMAALLRSARAVVSDNQALINDPKKGDKGFTGDFVLKEAKFNFRMETGINIDKIDPKSLESELLRAEMRAISEIVDEAQPHINKKGVGAKGFLPAIFAAKVATQFKKNKGDKAEIKLTAPSDYVRNKQNMPDKWEHEVIENRFRTRKHPIGRAVAAGAQTVGNRQAFRLILPEYYVMSCLPCHGQPKGAPDKTGGKKEGGTLGALGGAISVVIYGN